MRILKNIYFDSETTDLNPGQICQLSYIIEEDYCLTARNYFFAVRSMNPTAFSIHGFSVRDLYELSDGQEFGDVSEQIAEDFSGARLIAHNVDFDREFLQTELMRCGLQIKGSSWFCTMIHFISICKLPHSGKRGYKYPSLVEFMQFNSVEEEEVLQLTADLFESSSGRHDARYDTVALYLSYQNALKNGYIR